MAEKDVSQEAQELSEPSSERLQKTLAGHTTGVTCVAYSPDGKYIASGDKAGTINVWNADISMKEDNPIYSIEGHKVLVSSVHYSPDGTSILSSAHDNTLCIWDANNGQILGEPLKGHTDMVYSATYSPDGKTIVSGSRDHTIRVWNVKSRETILGPLEGHTEAVCSVLYSPDGQHIASTSYDYTIRIWDAKTGELLVAPLSQPHGIYTSTYLPDGKLFAAGCNDNNIYIWDLQTRSHSIEPLKGHSGFVDCVSISPNGKYLVSCSQDCTVRIWDLETGKQATPSLVFEHQMHTIAYSPDGEHIVSGSEDNRVQIWDAQIPELDSLFLLQNASQVPNLNGSSISKSSNTSTSSLVDVEIKGSVDEFFKVPASTESLSVMGGPSDEAQSKKNKESGRNQGPVLSGPLENLVAREEVFPIVRNNKSKRYQDDESDHVCIGMAESAAPARHHYSEFAALEARDSITESDSNKSWKWSCVLCGLNLF